MHRYLNNREPIATSILEVVISLVLMKKNIFSRALVAAENKSTLSIDDCRADMSYYGLPIISEWKFLINFKALASLAIRNSKKPYSKFYNVLT